MKRVTRAQLRGKPLDADCKRYARSSGGQYGAEDKRCYCSGLYNKMYEEIERKCRACPAFEENAMPLDEGEEAYKEHLDIYG